VETLEVRKLQKQQLQPVTANDKAIRYNFAVTFFQGLKMANLLQRTLSSVM
jgi:hypothetical protein